MFEEIDGLLKDCRLPFCFDITENESSCLFIFSPEGEESVAIMIDDLVVSAPEIPQWKVFGRRQRKPFDDVCAFIRHLYLVDLSMSRFRLTQRADGLYVQIFISPDADLTTDERQGLINTFLWHVYGEDVVMANHITGEAILATPSLHGSLSATEFARSL